MIDASATVALVTLRARALAAVRAFFAARDVVEVDTALLVSHPGLEPHIDPLAVSVRASLEPHCAPTLRWLTTSPELALKKLVAQGLPRVFQLGKVFRDGEVSARHAFEFTMCEWYCAHSSLDAMAAQTAELMRAMTDAVGNRSAIDVHAPFATATCNALFQQHAQVDLHSALARIAAGDEGALTTAVRAAGHALPAHARFDDAFFHVMVTCVEPHIGREVPMVVTQWPAQMAVLAKRCAHDGLLAERFEIYAGGLELCNAFDELTDAVEQRARFLQDNRTRAQLGKPQLPLDEVLLQLLPRMPQTSGNALGFDRVLMLLTGAPTLRAIAWGG